MKHFLASITFLILSIAYQQQIDISALKKDPILVQCKKIMKEISDGTISKKYIFPTDKTFHRELTSNPSKENMKKVLKANGMTNADEYVDKLFLQTSLMSEFLKKHPELSKLDPKKKQEVLSQLFFD